MAGNSYKMTGRIADVTRIRNSYYGNPRFEITLVTSSDPTHSLCSGTECEGDHMYRTLKTASEASFNYEVGNKGLRANDVVTVTIGGRGTIVAMHAA